MTNTIVGKLTVFVGVLVGLNTAMLIGAAFVTTSSILSDQVRDRLEAIAGDRQEILLQALQQQQERASRLAGRAPIRASFARYAGGTMTASQFAEEAGGFLSNVQAHSAGLLALWAEDAPGRVIAASDPDRVVAELARAERTSTETASDGGLVVPPRRVLGTYAAVFSGVVRDDDGRVLGTLLLAADLGLVMAFLSDTHGLGDHGEVMVVWKGGDRIHFPLPPRGKPALVEVTAREFPSLDAATSGEYGFIPTTDYRDRDVLVAYRPLGVGYPNWGLIAKVDEEEAYEPVARLRQLLLVLGGGLLALGLGASNAIARRFARPIRRAGADLGRGRRGRPDGPQRGHLLRRDRPAGPGVQPDDRGARPLLRRSRAADRRADPRPGVRPRPARRLLPDLHLADGPGQHRQDVRHRPAVLLRPGLRPGDDLAGGARGRRDPGRPRVRQHGGRGRPDGAPARRRRHPGHRGPRGPRDRRARRHGRPALRRRGGRGGRHPRPGRPADGQRRGPRHPPGGHPLRAGPRPPGPPPSRVPGLAHRPRPGRAPPDRGDPPAQPEPPGTCAGAGPLRAGAARADPHPPVGPGLHGQRRRRRRCRRAVPGLQPGGGPDPRPGPRRDGIGPVVPPLRGLPPRSGHAVSLGRAAADAGHARRVGRLGRALHRLSQPRGRHLDHGHRPPAAGRERRDRGGRGRLPRHHPAQEGRAPAGRPVRHDPRAGRGRLARPGRPQDPRDHRHEPGLGPRGPLAGEPPRPSPPGRNDLEPADRGPRRLRGHDARGRHRARGAAARPGLGRGRARVDRGHRRRARVPPPIGRRRVRPACRLRRADPAPAAIAWASSSSSAARPGPSTTRPST